jgi:predicted transposase YdaD
MKRDDTLWKTVLEDTFDDFLRFFIPDADEVFDFDKGVEYLDKELDQLFPPEGDEYKPRYVDKLVKVYTRQGTEEWVLVHVEVQGYRDNHFAKRMFQYYTRIWDKYDRSIAAFAIFTDSEAGFMPTSFQQGFLGTAVSYTYNSYKISNQQEEALMASNNPFAQVVLTVKGAIQGKRMSDDELFGLKIGIAKRLYYSGFDKNKIRKIMNFLKYYIRFENEEMVGKFEQELAIVTQNDKTVMGTEEFLLYRAKKEGIQEGIELGIEKGEGKGEAKAKQKIIQKLFLKNWTVEQIAEFAEVSVDFVLAIKRGYGPPK